MKDKTCEASVWMNAYYLWFPESTYSSFLCGPRVYHKVVSITIATASEGWVLLLDILTWFATASIPAKKMICASPMATTRFLWMEVRSEASVLWREKSFFRLIKSSKKIRCCFNKVIIQYNKFYLTRATLITIVVLPLVAQITLEQSLVILRSRKTMLWSLSLHIGVLW